MIMMLTKQGLFFDLLGFCIQATTHQVKDQLMQVFQPFTAPSLLSVPSDVITQHVYPSLSCADLATSSMTCATLRKVYLKFSARHVATTSTQLEPYEGHDFQRKLLESLFQVGSFSQLLWFQNILKYPGIHDLSWLVKPKYVSLAAKGTC